MAARLHIMVMQYARLQAGGLCQLFRVHAQPCHPDITGGFRKVRYPAAHQLQHLHARFQKKPVDLPVNAEFDGGLFGLAGHVFPGRVV